MQEQQNKSILSHFNSIFLNESPAKENVTEIRPLNDDELRAVAGGPECEVGNGA